MKKFLKLFLIISIFILSTGCLFDEKNETEQPKEADVKTSYKVTFDTTGGTEIGAQTVEEGKTVIRPSNPVKEGYRFVKWVTDDGKTFNFNTEIKENITLTAIYELKEETYKVTFDTKDGSNSKSVTVKKGEKVAKPENPIREGYTFSEWQLNGKTYDFNKIVESDITLEAKWNEASYTVKFDSNGGSSVSSQSIKNSGVASKPKNSTKAGWTFVEWQLEGRAFEFKTPITKDITLVATWNLARNYYKTESLTKTINQKSVKFDFRYFVEKTMNMLM